MVDPSILAYIQRAIRAGYGSRADMVASATDFAEAESSDAVEAGTVDAMAIAAAIDAAAASLIQEQASWPADTDTDRLDRAFAALERSRILARQDFTCCQSCGHAEIWDEAGEDDGAWRGYVFFHSQDTDAAIDGSGLYLGYGAATGDSDATTAIGTDVVATLRAAGLPVTWDGSVNSRIHVHPFEWRRRIDPRGFTGGD